MKKSLEIQGSFLMGNFGVEIIKLYSAALLTFFS